MNSQSLQKAFPQVYRDFFAKCPLVVSAPRHIMWMGEYTVRHGGVAMHQILPIRGYVGLAPRKDKKEIRVQDCLIYDPIVQNFKKEDLDHHQKVNIEKNLSIFLKKTCGLELDSGFDIYIILELPLEHSLGRAGVLMAPMIVAFLLYYNFISNGDIASWSACPLQDLINNPTTKFDFVFRILWKWEVFNYTIGSATSSFCSLTPSKTPLLFFSHRDTASLSADLKNKLRKNKIEIDDLKFIDSSYYWGARTSEVFGEHVGWPWPFDWGVIHTGGMLDVVNLEFLIEDKQKELRDNTNEIIKLFQNVTGNKKDDEQPEFYRLCKKENTRENFWQGYLGSLHALSLQLLLELKQFLENGFSQKRFFDLVNAMNKVHNILHNLFFHSANNSSIKTDLFLNDFFKEKIGLDSLGTKISSFSTHGSLIFAVPSLVARPWIKKMIKSLREKINSNISFDYLSWEDNVEDEGGVRIEQNLFSKLFSPFMPGSSATLEEYSKSGKNSQMIVLEQINKTRFDLLLDTIHEKVYINGRPVTSKKIPSQKALIKILPALLEHQGNSVSNKELPLPTYSSYRNEFQGKISSPLVKFLGDKIKIEVEGELMNFTINLKLARGTRVGVLKTI